MSALRIAPSAQQLRDLVEETVAAQERAHQALKKAQRLQSTADVKLAAMLFEVAALVDEEAH